MTTKTQTQDQTECETDAQGESYPRDTRKPERVDGGPLNGPCKAKNSSRYHSMPQYLREEFFEILIIAAEADFKEAEECQSFLKTALKCRIELLGIGVAPVNHLEACLEKTMYTFIYVTKKLCECTWSSLLSQVSLKKTLEDNDKKWTVIPVHTQFHRDYKLPLPLRYLEPINFWRNDRDVGKISKLLNQKKAEMDQRELILKERRSKWLAENSQMAQKEQVICNGIKGNEALDNQNTMLMGGGKPIKAENLPALVEGIEDIALSSMQHIDRREHVGQPGAGQPGSRQPGTGQSGADQSVASQPGAETDISVDSVSPVDSGVYCVSNRSVGSQSNGAEIIINNTKIFVNMQQAETVIIGDQSKYAIPGPEETDSE